MDLPNSTFSDEHCEYLLSLSKAELRQLLVALPVSVQQVVRRRLSEYQTPTERCERSLYEFVRQAWHIVEPDCPFIDGWHIRAICRHLEAVEEGTIRNLLINVPPGHCKSRICNVFFPAWTWARKPSARFLHASYAQELATRDSVDCRYVIGSDWYRARWGRIVRLTDDQNQKIKFSTSQHGWRMATSIDGRGTGEHPDFVIVDDPHNVKQAESEVERRSCLKWWDATIASRGLIRGVRRVVIMQRLHVSDLSGHILDQGGFDHICLPYRYESGRMKPTTIGWTDPRTRSGELLWPAIPEQMKQTFAGFAPRLDAGQLQQRPVPEGGAMFKRDWFKIVPRLPDGITIAVRYWDKAASENAGDYSAGVLIVRDDDLWYVADVLRGQWSVRQRNQIILQTAQLDSERFENSMTVIEQEPGSGGKESAEFTIRQLAGLRIRADKVTGAKEIRAQPFADQCEADNVRVVKGPWNMRFIEELSVFPAGDYDDQVDAASGAFSWSLRVPVYQAPTALATGFSPHRYGLLLDCAERDWRSLFPRR
jgi:predicted phage terminase large subunit-like protein